MVIPLLEGGKAESFVLLNLLIYSRAVLKSLEKLCIIVYAEAVLCQNLNYSR